MHLLNPLPVGFGLIKCELCLEILYGNRNTSYDKSQMLYIPSSLALYLPAGCRPSRLINLAMIFIAEWPPCQGYSLDAVSAHPFDLQRLLQPPAVTSTAHELGSCQETLILAGY